MRQKIYSRACGIINTTELFGFGLLPSLQKHRLRLAEETKKAEMCQASVDAKRADEVQAQPSGGEVAKKKSKVTYRHFGSWEPKGDNYVVTTYDWDMRYITLTAVHED